jgi:methionine-rich copper-binding protein CopC
MTFRKSLAAILLASATLAAVSGSAFAHAALLQSDPAPNSTVAAPKEIKLTFSEKLTPAFSGFELSMSDSMTMKVATKVSEDGKSLIGTPAGSFMAGAYKISWHATSSDDGHRMDGSLTFKVK